MPQHNTNSQSNSKKPSKKGKKLSNVAEKKQDKMAWDVYDTLFKMGMQERILVQAAQLDKKGNPIPPKYNVIQYAFGRVTAKRDGLDRTVVLPGGETCIGTLTGNMRHQGHTPVLPKDLVLVEYSEKALHDLREGQILGISINAVLSHESARDIHRQRPDLLPSWMLVHDSPKDEPVGASEWFTDDSDDDDDAELRMLAGGGYSGGGSDVLAPPKRGGRGEPLETGDVLLSRLRNREAAEEVRNERAQLEAAKKREAAKARATLAPVTGGGAGGSPDQELDERVRALIEMEASLPEEEEEGETTTEKGV